MHGQVGRALVVPGHAASLDLGEVGVDGAARGPARDAREARGVVAVHVPRKAEVVDVDLAHVGPRVHAARDLGGGEVERAEVGVKDGLHGSGEAGQQQVPAAVVGKGQPEALLVAVRVPADALGGHPAAEVVEVRDGEPERARGAHGPAREARVGPGGSDDHLGGRPDGGVGKDAVQAVAEVAAGAGDGGKVVGVLDETRNAHPQVVAQLLHFFSLGNLVLSGYLDGSRNTEDE